MAKQVLDQQVIMEVLEEEAVPQGLEVQDKAMPVETGSAMMMAAAAEELVVLVVMLLPDLVEEADLDHIMLTMQILIMDHLPVGLPAEAAVAEVP